MPKQVQTVVGAALIVVLTIVAYLPAFRADFVWDDPQHITDNATLRSLGGLRHMWTDINSLPQWYPLTHTTFWIEYQLWEQRPTGYHAVNIILHSCNALLLWRLLARLSLPGAWLAACLFAVHPVHVESVAWITERKNILSSLFYLLSALAYLRARPLDAEERRIDWGWYTIALPLFVCALLSKTVTASLPAALLLVIWWKRGHVGARDVTLLVPFFAIGLFLALNTARLEQVRVAQGQEWQYADTALGDFLARTIIAGKALWFYAWKLVWPVNLAFIYERWQIDWRDVRQYAYPASVLLVIASLFALRRRIGRGPLVAVLFFAGTLFPALGFFNVFPHRYAFVADHFQYLASIGLIAMIASTLLRIRVERRAMIAVVVAALGTLTFLQARHYLDAETLWRHAARLSPGNWMVWTNLGNALAQQKRYDEAIPLYERALELAPHVHDVQWNAGVARARQGRYRDAEQHFRRAVEIMPTFRQAWESLGDLYADELNEPGKALQAYQRAHEIAPWLSGPKQKMQRLR